MSFDDFVDETTFPRIIGSGEFWCLDPLCIAAEGEELITLGAGSSMANALGLFLSIMYLALTIQPRPVMFTFFVKCSSALDKMPKKRIAINKFISAL